MTNYGYQELDRKTSINQIPRPFFPNAPLLYKMANALHLRLRRSQDSGEEEKQHKYLFFEIPCKYGRYFYSLDRETMVFFQPDDGHNHLAFLRGLIAVGCRKIQGDGREFAVTVPSDVLRAHLRLFRPHRLPTLRPEERWRRKQSLRHAREVLATVRKHSKNACIFAPGAGLPEKVGDKT